MSMVKVTENFFSPMHVPAVNAARTTGIKQVFYFSRSTLEIQTKTLKPP